LNSRPATIGTFQSLNCMEMSSPTKQTPCCTLKIIHRKRQYVSNLFL